MQVHTADTNVAVDLPVKCFARDFSEALVHQAVVAYLAGARSGTRAQKGRADVRGGGIKPFRQKGTGRARAGSIRSPIWRGGGKVFAATTRDFSQKINRKMYRAAMASILSELLRQERLRFIEAFIVENGKTRDAVAMLEQHGLQSGLLVLAARDEKTELALRNIPHIAVCTVAEINPANLVAAEQVLMTVDAIKHLEGWLA